LHNAGVPFTAPTPMELKTVDIVSVFSPVALKRGRLLLESLLSSNATAYVFAQSLGSSPQLLESLLEAIRNLGKQIEYFYYPFDPYALLRIDGRIVIDGRPIGANNSIVSAYLARARLFVHTSTTEGISNSIMEALINDVPVLICDDIRGPLQALSRQIPQCIFRSSPDIFSLVTQISSLLAIPRPTGSVRTAFRNVIDPFEINRQIVRGVQACFERLNLPWKGHCLGILGGVQSKLNLVNVGAEESYRGCLHIYPNLAEAAQCLTFQQQVALATGRSDHALSLQAELQFIQTAIVPAMAEVSLTSLSSRESKLMKLLSNLAKQAFLRQVLIIGAAANNLWRAMVEQLVENPNEPQIYCIETLKSSHESLTRQFAGSIAVHCHHTSTVPISALPSEEMVCNFYQHNPDKLKDYPLEVVLQWLQSDTTAMLTGEISLTSMHTVLHAADVAQFDMVVIDGREFTGFAELQQFYGARIVLLGCTRTFKNQHSVQLLSQDENYKLLFCEPDVGNGFAGFVHKAFNMESCLHY